MYKHLKYKIQSTNSMMCLFKHKPMKKDVSEIDVFHSDGERQIQSTNSMMHHEKDEVRVPSMQSMYCCGSES